MGIKAVAKNVPRTFLKMFYSLVEHFCRTFFKFFPFCEHFFVEHFSKMFTVRNNFTKFGKIQQNVPHGEHFSNCSTKFSMFTENVLQIWAKFVEHLLFLPGMKREKSHSASKTMIFREHFCIFLSDFSSNSVILSDFSSNFVELDDLRSFLSVIR